MVAAAIRTLQGRALRTESATAWATAASGRACGSRHTHIDRAQTDAERDRRGAHNREKCPATREQPDAGTQAGERNQRLHGDAEGIHRASCAGGQLGNTGSACGGELFHSRCNSSHSRSLIGAPLCA